MSPLILLALIAGLPVVLALLLRVNAVFLFVSVAAGYLLVTYLAKDADLALGMVLKSGDTPTIAKLTLQLTPVVLTILFLRKTLPRTKIVLHVLPAIATGMALGVFVLSYLDNKIQDTIFAAPYGDQFKRSQSIIVAASAVLTLLLAWITYRHKAEKAGKHK